MRYGAEALGNYLLAKQLRERAELLGDGIEELAQFDELVPGLDDEILATACQANPLLPQCADDFVPQDSGFGLGGITIGGNGQNSVIGPGGVSDSAGDIRRLASNPLGGNSKDQLFGGVGSRTVNGNDSFVSGIPGAARLRAGAAAGGGGGGGGRAGSPAPPSPSRPSSGGGGGGNSGPTTSKVKYTGGSGRLAYKGSGRGLKNRKPAGKKSKGNPFKKLFGNKGRTLDFGSKKGGIGGKGGDIFARLSDRYKKVNSAGNRLIEYKVK